MPSAPFEIADATAFCSALNAAIWSRVPETGALAQRLSLLTHHERAFLSVDMFGRDALCEGVGHFFEHEQGELYEVVISGLREIRADALAETLIKYVSIVFGETVPTDEFQRQRILDANREAEEEADELFRHFLDMHGELEKRLSEWSRANRQHFRV
ncbi:DMP19 family protein [Inhella proteolytica]|uniref:DUF4375 domain-containing protein n=1 Tax=Inhella proteolytica TaxID=2795029 RepID=A0A931J6F3_9BURK|nr:DUF4375 domain-containing protein [Inhella proteolytica]MBH9579100.1 DUF4375 domain-containing protein [Inhella proteolytica]